MQKQKDEKKEIYDNSDTPNLVQRATLCRRMACLPAKGTILIKMSLPTIGSIAREETIILEKRI